MQSESPSPSWGQRAGQLLRELADRPLVLLAVLLAVNAIARPYANIEHDTRLYSVQVLNQVEDGIYNDDLFFRYGSQDRFSIFSKVMAPLVRTMGLQPAFFLVYLLGNAVVLWGMICLVRRLCDDRVLAVVSLVYLVVTPLNYGGQYILAVHENFLTPRLLTVGLVLLALDKVLESRFALALAFLVPAALLHPLMAAGGWLIWLGAFLWAKLGGRNTVFAVVACSVLVGVVLALPSVAGRFLGTMDEGWREMIRVASSFNFPSEWDLRDWINIALCGLGLGAGVVCFYRSEAAASSRFCAVAAFVGLAAVLGTMIAATLPYALLFQGQPYRALWILKVLQVPLCAMLVVRLWSTGDLLPRVAAFLIAAFFLTTTGIPLEAFLPLLFFPVAVLAYRGLESTPRYADWFTRSVVSSVVAGGVCWAAYKEWLIVTNADQILDRFDVSTLVYMMLANLGFMTWIIVVAGSLLMLCGGGLRLQTVGLLALGVCLAAQTCSFALPQTEFVREHGTRHLRDVVFVRDYLQQNRGQQTRLPSVYSIFGKVEYVWLEMKANSYFDWWQAGGFMFDRQTAVEGQRRALLVAPFELERFRELEMFSSATIQADVKRFFRRELHSPEPTVEDLARLCSEADLDYVVLRRNFPGLSSASNGRVFVYECRHVQAALAGSSGGALAAAELPHDSGVRREENSP